MVHHLSDGVDRCNPVWLIKKRANERERGPFQVRFIFEFVPAFEIDRGDLASLLHQLSL